MEQYSLLETELHQEFKALRMEGCARGYHEITSDLEWLIDWAKKHNTGGVEEGPAVYNRGKGRSGMPSMVGVDIFYDFYDHVIAGRVKTNAELKAARKMATAGCAGKGSCWNEDGTCPHHHEYPLGYLSQTDKKC